ncbi:transposase, partial [Thiocapsa sp.]|uniref:transposase n=1 Tax=Thiocapsa sp. TaxID=2024551 RepID=UPI0035932F10
MPKRLRWYLEREPHAVSAILHIFLRVIEAHIRASSPTGSPRARLGAVSYVHRFGSALNRHVHLHCCIIDGLFDPGEDGQVRFLQAPVLTTDEMAAITEQVRRRVLRWFARSGLLEPAEARDMLGREHGGFSPDAAVR